MYSIAHDLNVDYLNYGENDLKYTALFLLLTGLSVMLILGVVETKPAIYVYNDEGVSKESLKQTLHTLQTSSAHQYDIKTINAKQVALGHWTQHAVLFVMPGGADRPYVKKLAKKGNLVIKTFVQQGGGYLGICAGSYYGSGFVEFDKGGPFEVLGTRALAFFPGKAIGPVLAPYDYKTNSGVRAARIEVNLKPIQNVALYYNGGNFFEHAEHYPNVTVIGRYTGVKGNHLPAIIHIRYGQGNVVLSGVHYEYDPFFLDQKDHYLSDIIPALKKENALRKILFDRLIYTAISRK